MDAKAVNIVEKLVWDKLEEVIAYKPDMCKCDKCKADIAAYALNRLGAKYVVSTEGELYARTEILDKDFNTALLVTLTEAMELVAKNPKHDKEL